MQRRLHKGMVLIEAVATVVIVSVSLVFIAQNMATALKAGERFKQMAALIVQMQNRLGFAWVTPEGLKPVPGYINRQDSTAVTSNLNRQELFLVPEHAGRARGMGTTTFVYHANP